MIGGKRAVATIEVRMTSARLPGKIMMPLSGKPVMAHMIERHRRSKLTDEVV
ncbi:MAG: cytidylyltransferase, partial [Patescibacteria group bacterium]